ncbi:MAG: dTDP-4-amino-4,6-dideoxyglucose formyltransferase [Bacteroidetes bacterium]|nr:dTDP-4-amino-4,6-dideoxyglucose formyltransferase [Bacteroidota bacterium]
MKSEWKELAETYDLIFSLHCKQLFPAELVGSVKCINVHPGLNPFNRGWYPQVFSILNKKKSGATIHEIDEQLDHGPIIAQKEVVIEKWDTSLSAYNKILNAEVDLLNENLEKIIEGNYTPFRPKEEGNVNLKKDFNALREIDLNKQVSMEEAIDYLRAMSHGEYKNAWFLDPTSGKKVYVSIDLETQEES